MKVGFGGKPQGILDTLDKLEALSPSKFYAHVWSKILIRWKMHGIFICVFVESSFK